MWRCTHLHKPNRSQSLKISTCSSASRETFIIYKCARFNWRGQQGAQSSIYIQLDRDEYVALYCCNRSGDHEEIWQCHRTHFWEDEKSHSPERGCERTTAQAARRQHRRQPHSCRWGLTWQAIKPATKQWNEMKQETTPSHSFSVLCHGEQLHTCPCYRIFFQLKHMIQFSARNSFSSGCH